MKTSKKLLSFFLAVVMVVTTCSVGFTAFAKDNKNSIWSTSCKANDAYDTLNTLVDTYLPAALLGNETVGPAIYAKLAAAIGVKVEELTEHQKAVIAGTKKPVKGDNKNLRAATMQDVLGVLQPILLEALSGTSQEKYASIAFGENTSAGLKDPSYFDYLKKYVTVNGKQEEDKSSMTFYTLYGLCRNFKDNSNLSKETRDTLSEWYDALKEISYLVPQFDIDKARALIDKFDSEFLNNYGYLLDDTYSVEEIAGYFDASYEDNLSDDDKALLKSVYSVCEQELAFFGITDVKIDSLAKLLYYGCGDFKCSKFGKMEKYNNLYFDLIKSVNSTITYTGKADFFGFGETYEFEITEPLTKDNYVSSIILQYIKTQVTEADIIADYGHGYDQLTDDEIVKIYGDLMGYGEDDFDFAKSDAKAQAIYAMNKVIFDSYGLTISKALAVKYSDDIKSVADIDKLAAEIMPANYKSGNVLTEQEIKEMASFFRTFNGSYWDTYLKDGVVTGEDAKFATATATLPASIKDTAVSEYLAKMFKDGKENYQGDFLTALYSNFNSTGGNPWYVDESGAPATAEPFKRYPVSNLLVLNYNEPNTYSVEKINEYFADAEEYAYAKVIAEALEIDEDSFLANSKTQIKSVFDYKAFVDSKNVLVEEKPVLNDDQKKILYGNYDFTGEMGTELVNLILNDTVLSILSQDLVNDIVSGLVEGDLDLEAAIADVWKRVCNDPVATVFELVPVIVSVADSVLVPVLFNGEGDAYKGLFDDPKDGVLNGIHNLVPAIAELLYNNGSYVGIKNVGWDLNKLLPQLMHWLAEGKDAQGIEYYDGSTKTLMTVVEVTENDVTTKEIVEKVFTYKNCNEIDFAHYVVKDRSGNVITPNSDKNNKIVSYTYLGKTEKDLSVLLKNYKKAEFLCYMTYRSDVPLLTGIYFVDEMLSYAKLSDLEGLFAGLLDYTNKTDSKGNVVKDANGNPIKVLKKDANGKPITSPSATAKALTEAVNEIALLFTTAVDEFVNSDKVNQKRLVASSNGATVACKGLNNLFVAIPQLLDIMENLAAEKYGIAKNAWTYCYKSKIVNDPVKGYVNTNVEDVKVYAGSNDPNRSVNILDWFVDLFVSDWLNAILDLATNVVETDNKISSNIPIVAGLLNALGGFGKESVLTDILNGVFQLDRDSKFSFTFKEQSTGFNGFSTNNAYFLITNIEKLITVVTDLVDTIKAQNKQNQAANNNTSAPAAKAAAPIFQAKTAKVTASKGAYTSEEISNATDLINNLDKMISSLLSDSSFNGFNLGSIDNIAAGLVSFLSNYLGKDCYTDLGKLLDSYTYYITGKDTNTADKNGNVDAKKVYTNESLTALVVETFKLIEDLAENLLAAYNKTYQIDTKKSAQYNLLVEAIEGLISPDAIAVRLDGYDKVQTKLHNYDCWHNAAAQTSRGDYKVKLDWGIKAGDKDAFFNGLSSSLRLVSSILGVLLVDAGMYESILFPALQAVCKANGIAVDTPSQFGKTTNGYYDELLIGLIKPIAGFANSFLAKPVTTLLVSLQGIAGILDDNNGLTIASIIKSAVTPIGNEIKGLAKIFNIKSAKLNATSPTLAATINGLAAKVMKYANANNIKLGSNKQYSLSGANIVSIINDALAMTGITLPAINWNKLSTASSPAVVLIYIAEYVLNTLLDTDNLDAIDALINNDIATMIIGAIESLGLTAADVLGIVNQILEATDSPTLAYWTFAQYLQKAATGFTYPAGITKPMADEAVGNLDNLVSAIFPLLGSLGVDLGGDNLKAILNKNLFKNELLTTLATALYGALDGLDPTIKAVLKSLGIVTSTKDVANILVDKSYGATYSSAAKAIKAQSNWSKVKNVNWGFKDGSAKAQQGFVNALAAILRPLDGVLEVFLNEGTLQLNDVAIGAIKAIKIAKTETVLVISDDKDENGKDTGKTPIKCKVTYEMKNGVLTVTFREDPKNRKDSKPSTLVLDFNSLKDLKDLKLEGTNAYNSAIIPLLEVLQCGNISTYAQYQKHVGAAKDNLLLDILNPLVGDNKGSFLNKLLAAPAKELTTLLPNLAMYLEADGLVQLVCNLLAPITDIEGLTGEGSAQVADLIVMILDAPIQDAIIPLVNMFLESSDNEAINKLQLPEINWNLLVSLGTKTTYTSKAVGENGKYLTGKIVGNVDNGKVLVTVLRYVATILVDNISTIKSLLTSIDAIKNNDMIKSIVSSVLTTLGASTPDQIVSALFFIIAGSPQNAFWDYTSYKTGNYSFAYPESVDVDFLKQLPPMLDGLIGGLVDLNGLIGGALFKDELVSKLAKGLYGAIEGVKINDSLNLTALLAQTDIDFSAKNVAKLLVDERYGQKFESAASTIAAAGSWANVKVESLKWGVTDRDSFFHALVAVLRPLYGVLDVLLNDAYLGLFDIVRLPGSNGYTSSIVPLMEAFSMYNIKTQYQYRQDIIEEYDAILLDIINPIWDLVEDVLNAPLQTVTAIIPNLALFIGNDGLCQILDNLLTPISAIADAIRPIVDLNDLLDTLFKALNVDLNGILGKIGITNFSLDVYDLNATLKQVLGGDKIIPLVNNVLGMINIKGTPLSIKLNAVDWLQLASHGTTVVSYSQAATFGARIFVKGDSSETLIAILRYLIDTVNSGDNFNKISNLVGGLIGGDNGSASEMVGTVLGLIQGDTDEVIASLVELLQSIA